MRLSLLPSFAALCLAYASLTSCKASFDLNLHADPPTQLGAELQAYPAGIIPGIRAEWPGHDQDLWFARFAYNATDRHSWGEHDDESGGGFGLGVGYRRWDREECDGWHYGGRIDFWSMDIDWKNGAPGFERGTSDVLVVQPTIEGGYTWHSKRGARIDLTAGLGSEINVDTDGEDVGEGAIFLIGLTFMPGKR